MSRIAPAWKCNAIRAALGAGELRSLPATPMGTGPQGQRARRRRWGRSRGPVPRLQLPALQGASLSTWPARLRASSVKTWVWPTPSNQQRPRPARPTARAGASHQPFAAQAQRRRGRLHGSTVPVNAETRVPWRTKTGPRPANADRKLRDSRLPGAAPCPLDRPGRQGARRARPSCSGTISRRPGGGAVVPVVAQGTGRCFRFENGAARRRVPQAPAGRWPGCRGAAAPQFARRLLLSWAKRGAAAEGCKVPGLPTG